MTDQEMIKVYLRLDDQCGDIGDQIEDLENDRDSVCYEMDGVEEEWLKTHSCACGLIGLENSCPHEEVE